MHKLCVTDYLSPPAAIEQEQLAGLADVECLQAKSEEELIGKLNNADVLLVFHEVSITKAVIETLERCKAIVRAGIGIDNVDLQAAGARGIRVCNTPDYGVDEVADHAIGLMLACNRGFMPVERQLRDSLRPWDYKVIQSAFRLCEATIGIVGLGRIGTATALRAKALKMRVLACDPYIPSGIDKAIGVQMVELPALLAESDIVSLHVPLTDETRHMIDADALAAMKSRAILVNTARGAVVDVDALADALETGRIAGAGIDVLPIEPPDANMSLIRLWQQRSNPTINLVVTPHCAFYSESSLIEMRTKSAQEIARVLRGQPPKNCVNSEYMKP